MLTEADWKLLLIRQRTLVGKIADKHDIYKIDKIAVLSLSDADPVDVELEVRRRISRTPDWDFRCV